MAEIYTKLRNKIGWQLSMGEKKIVIDPSIVVSPGHVGRDEKHEIIVLE